MPGLTDDELDAVEQRFGFTFAEDHRAFLQAVLPVGERWPDWRHGSEQALGDQLAWPVRGVLFDVEHADVWPADWGMRPPTMTQALVVAEERLATVPQLVPVYGHRYLPAGRGSGGHPVLSVYQTDIIYYGLDLDDYIHREFELPASAPPRARLEPARNGDVLARLPLTQERSTQFCDGSGRSVARRRGLPRPTDRGGERLDLARTVRASRWRVSCC
jgi:hypothetical protein